MMNTFARRVAVLPSSIGWAGGIGLALLASACILGLSLLLPAREEGDNLLIELQQLESKLGRLAPAAQPVATVRQQFDEFLSSLPKQDQINAQLTLLHELAARNRLALRNGEYRTSSAKAGPIGRLQITVKTEGSYTDLRRFLQEIPAALPALAVSRLSMSRQKPSDTALEANVEFALYYTRAET
jgi:Tfp pilus assembly protein PilO